MKKSDLETKEMVRSKYGEIAQKGKGSNEASCCGSGGCSTEVYNIMTDDYSGVEGYSPEADLGLGCGLPTDFAMIKKGDTVIDLGSGAGNDCFIARHETGPGGKVIGIDFTPKMISRARENSKKMGFSNVEFLEGDIEDIPLENDIADVVVSNCVLNLVPAKDKAFSEIFRILKPGGHFSISDIVMEGPLPEKLKEAAEMYAGCVSGAIGRNEYLGIIKAAGFQEVVVQREKAIFIPDDILAEYIDKKEIESFRNGSIAITSITVFGQKPNL